MEIVRLYARKAWIGKGVGARLMTTCINAAVQAGCDVIWLGVWERNLQAIAFYRRWGFGQVARQVFQLGDEAQQDWVMTKPLTGSRHMPGYSSCH